MNHQGLVFSIALIWLALALSPLVGVPLLLPSISQDFGTSTSATSWVILAYSLGMAGAFMPATHIGDLIGYRRAALIGSYLGIGFLILLTLAPNFAFLIFLRFVQGIVHSLAIANFITLAVTSYPQEKRGRAGGLLGASLGIGMFFIPIYFGFLVDLLSWRWVFIIEASVVFGITLVATLLLGRKDSAVKKKPTLREFDIPGALLLMAAIAPLLISVQFISDSSLVWPWLLLIISIVLLFIFVIFEARLDYATLPVRMFKQSRFAATASCNVAVELSYGMVIYLMPIFFIQALGWSAAFAGSVIFMAAIARPPASVATGFLADRFGGFQVAFYGALTMVISLVGLALLSPRGQVLWVITFLMLFGVAHSLLRTGLLKQMFASVQQDQLGLAPGVLGLGRHVGGAIGVAIGAALYVSTAGEHSSVGGVGAAEGFRFALFTGAVVLSGTFIVGLIAFRRHGIKT